MTEWLPVSVKAFRMSGLKGIIVSHHLFEGVLYGSYHQALVLDLLLGKEARRRRGVARGSRCTCGPAQRSGPGQGSVRARGVSLEVGVVVGLLAQDGRGQGG